MQWCIIFAQMSNLASLLSEDVGIVIILVHFSQLPLDILILAQLNSTSNTLVDS